MISVPDEHVDRVFGEWDDDLFDWLLASSTISKIKEFIPHLLKIEPVVYNNSYAFECTVTKKNGISSLTFTNKKKTRVVQIIQKDNVDLVAEEIDHLSFF